MDLSTKLERIISFFRDGKSVDEQTYQPDDVAVAMNAIEPLMQAGLSGKHLAKGVIKVVSFSGVDGSGLTPALNCTLTGAQLTDQVAAILNVSDWSDGAANFESVISVADEIQQSSLTDLSAVKYLAVLIKG